MEDRVHMENNAPTYYFFLIGYNLFMLLKIDLSQIFPQHPETGKYPEKQLSLGARISWF